MLQEDVQEDVEEELVRLKRERYIYNLARVAATRTGMTRAYLCELLLPSCFWRTKMNKICGWTLSEYQ